MDVYWLGGGVNLGIQGLMFVALVRRGKKSLKWLIFVLTYSTNILILAGVALSGTQRGRKKEMYSDREKAKKVRKNSPFISEHPFIFPGVLPHPLYHGGCFEMSGFFILR